MPRLSAMQDGRSKVISKRIPESQLVPWAAGSVGLGVLAIEAPLAATGVGLATGLALLPWMALFGALVVAATVQGFSWQVAGFTVRPDMVVAAVFALRAFTLKGRGNMERLEWLLIAFMAVQVVTSLLHAPDVSESLRTIGLLGFGVLAYLATVVALSSRERLLVAARVFLAVAAAGAAVGIALLASSWALGTSFGVTRLETLAGFPAANGLSYEHDLFGSTCAAATIAFLVLSRERNPLFSPGASALGFWVCLGGTVLSLARGAWVGFAVAFIATWLVSLRGSRGLARLIVFATLIACVGILVALSWGSSGDVGSSTASAVTAQASSSLNLSASATGARRLVEWRTSLHEVRTSLLLGLGTNSYGQRHFDETLNGPKPAFVGNWFVRTLYDSGLVGLLLLFAFAGPIVWPDARVRHANGELAGVVRALVLACVVLVVSYLATDSLLLVWPWVLLGLTRAARVMSAEEERSGRSV